MKPLSLPSALRSLVPAILLATGLSLTQCSSSDALPSGIYLRSVFSGTSLTNTILLFNNGQVAYNPEGDLENFDFAKFAAAQPKNIGTYAVSGGTLTIRWGDGSEQTGAIKPDGHGGFDFGAAPHAPVKPLPAGASLDGTFYGGASIAGASTSVTYTFSGGNQYKTDAAGVVVTSTSASDVTAGSSSEDTGTYAISGSRVTFTGAAGSRQTSLYYIPTSADAGKSPDMILLGGAVLTKQ